MKFCAVLNNNRQVSEGRTRPKPLEGCCASCPFFFRHSLALALVAVLKLSAGSFITYLHL